MNKQTAPHRKPEYDLHFTAAGLPSTLVADNGHLFVSSAFAAACAAALPPSDLGDPE